MTAQTWHFINDAKLVHYEKYRYSKSEYLNEETDIIITCPKHGDFLIKPSQHINGCGCPICNKTK